MFKENKGFLWKLIQDRCTPENHKLACAAMYHSTPDPFLALFGPDVKIAYISDEIDGLLFLPDAGCYGARTVVLDHADYTVIHVGATGIILPEKSEQQKRWLICCCKAEKWEALKPQLNARLGSLKKSNSPWRTAERTVIQYNKMKFLCGEDVVFKICRISDDA